MNKTRLRNLIRKIWNDPVWSKIVAAGIIGIGPILYATIKSIFIKVSWSVVIWDILNQKVKVMYLLGPIILGMMVWSLILKLRKKDLTYVQIQEMFENENTKMEDHDAGLMFRFKFTFKFDTPSLYDLNVYCTKHSPPMKLNDTGCPMDNCANNYTCLNMSNCRDLIESHLLAKWEAKKEER